MELKRVVSSSRVRVDSEDYSIKAGSLSFRDGFAEQEVMGTEGSEQIYSENPETAVGMITFELPATKENLDSIKKFQRGVHTVTCYEDRNGGLTRIMPAGVCTNDSDKTTGSDGSYVVTFKGNPLA